MIWEKRTNIMGSRIAYIDELMFWIAREIHMIKRKTFNEVSNEIEKNKLIVSMLEVIPFSNIFYFSIEKINREEWIYFWAITFGTLYVRSPPSFSIVVR